MLNYFYSLLVDWVFHGSYLLAFWFSSISTLTTSLQVELLILVPCSQPSCLLLVLQAPHHTSEPLCLPSFQTSWVASPTMALGQLLFSMVPTTSLLVNGGAMDSSYLLSTLLSGLELEEFGGSSLACGKAVGYQNLTTQSLVISDFCSFPGAIFIICLILRKDGNLFRFFILERIFWWLQWTDLRWEIGIQIRSMQSRPFEFVSEILTWHE